MKAILLLAGMLALSGIPSNAGTHIFVNFGSGGYHGNYFAANGSRCGYSAGFYSPYRSCGYVGYPGYYNGGYGYYGGYVSSYYPVVSYDPVVYAPSYVQPTGPVSAQASPSAPTAQSPVNVPAPSTAQAVPPPAQTPLPFGVLDVNGFVHSPYSDAIFKVPGVRNAQMVYDPVTGKPFLVR
jgi:hypothetical protein